MLNLLCEKADTLKIFILPAVLLFVACSDSYVHYPMMEYAELAAPVTTYAPYEKTWQEVYTDLLWRYYDVTAHLSAEESWLFTLYDINKDGIPELIIWESYFGSFFFASHAVYTFMDGEAHRLEIDEDFGGNPASLSIFAPPNGAPGIIVNGSGEGFRRYMFMRMEGHSLLMDVCATVSISPRHRGYDDILYFIRGTEAISVELPDFLYWLEEEYEWMLSRGYALVTEKEFYRVLDVIFGSMLERESVRPRSITKANINAIMCA